MSNSKLTITRRLVGQVPEGGEPVPRPLYVGHSAVSMPDGTIVVVGGGATCFSMGTFWNSGVYTLRLTIAGDENAGVSLPASRWVHQKTVDIVSNHPSPPAAATYHNTGKPAAISHIPQLKLETADDFPKIVREGRPVVMEGLNLGNCVSTWTLDYLVDKVGPDHKVGARHLCPLILLLTEQGRHPRSGHPGNGLYNEELPVCHSRVWRLCSESGTR